MPLSSGNNEDLSKASLPALTPELLSSSQVSQTVAANAAEVDRNNANHAHDETLSFGQRIADKIAATVGSWRFIALQTTLIGVWMISNMIPGMPHWDSNPFILLNLVMAFEASYTASIIMMSQNRQTDKDRISADIDHAINLRNEARIESLLTKIDHLEGEISSLIHPAKRSKKSHVTPA